MLRTHKVIIIRYSVYFAKTKSFILARRNTTEQYKEKLFDEKRLNMHEFLFLNVTMPSLVRQIHGKKEESVTVMLITSEDLPDKYLSRLYTLASEYSWLKVVLATHDSNISKVIDEAIHFEEKTLVATIRLDDDDALSANFLATVDRYLIEENADKCLTLARGINANFNSQTLQYSGFQEILYPKVAIGLTYIRWFDPQDDTPFVSIYGLGNHVKVNEVKKLIVDKNEISFLRTYHDLSDTAGVDANANVRVSIPNIDPTIFFEAMFSLNPSLCFRGG